MSPEVHVSTDLRALQKTALKACRMGREVLLNYLGNLKKIEAKFQAGLVSEADKESENVICAELKKNFPDIEFLGEETHYINPGQFNQPSTKSMRWILDPLDGTTNYVHQFPIFCISLGLEINGRIDLAVIDVPLMNETYTAIRGQGAFVNGQKICTSETRNLKDSLLATGFFGENEKYLQEQIKIFSDIVRQCRGIRRPGAAAYDLCMVARGVFDAYWEKGLGPWDSAAGSLLVEEAGGLVTTYRGDSYSPYKNSLIAGNKFIFNSLQKALVQYIDDDTH
ncbi:MAG: inositol monophosphatase family protein [Pseudobdellovibrionaceae bacterium]